MPRGRTVGLKSLSDVSDRNLKFQNVRKEEWRAIKVLRGWEKIHSKRGENWPLSQKLERKCKKGPEVAKGGSHAGAKKVQRAQSWRLSQSNQKFVWGKCYYACSKTWDRCTVQAEIFTALAEQFKVYDLQEASILNFRKAYRGTQTTTIRLPTEVAGKKVRLSVQIANLFEEIL